MFSPCSAKRRASDEDLPVTISKYRFRELNSLWHPTSNQSIYFLFYREDDFYNPMSVASIKAAEEEQMQDGETIEEFEDRVLNKRAGHLNNILKTKFQENMSIQFSEITRRNMRKKAAQNFYSILVLQKACAVNIDQADSYADIMVTKGPKFDSAVL